MVSVRTIPLVVFATLAVACGGSGINPSSAPITIYPSVANVPPGGAMTFLITGTNGYGSLTLSAARGTIQPAIGACEQKGFQVDLGCLPAGAYIAPTSGTDTITARDGGQATTASVTVSAANWLGQPMAISPSGGTIAPKTTVELIDLPFVSALPGSTVLGCFTSDGATCRGGVGSPAPSDGPGLTSVIISEPTVTSSLTLSQILVFMTAPGCYTPTCAIYSEALNVNFTITP